MQYSPRTEQEIEEEKEEIAKGSAKDKIAKYALTLIPHPEPRLLKAKFKAQERQQKKEEEQEPAGGAIKPW